MSDGLNETKATDSNSEIKIIDDLLAAIHCNKKLKEKKVTEFLRDRGLNTSEKKKLITVLSTDKKLIFWNGKYWKLTNEGLQVTKSKAGVKVYFQNNQEDIKGKTVLRLREKWKENKVYALLCLQSFVGLINPNEIINNIIANTITLYCEKYIFETNDAVLIPQDTLLVKVSTPEMLPAQHIVNNYTQINTIIYYKEDVNVIKDENEIATMISDTDNIISNLDTSMKNQSETISLD